MKTRGKAHGFEPSGRRAPGFVAGFDSATAMVRALANFLRGEDFPRLGILPHALSPVARAMDRLPRKAREAVYAWSGWLEAIPPGALRRVDAEAFSRWVAAEYPERRYPAVAVGSSNGAAVHLCAALGIPWLPQTFLIPVRRAGVPPDEPREELAWGREPGRALLDANPTLQLHHMHDPNQDRLMIKHMTYFRVKRLALGPCYERFLEERLAPDGTLLILDCERRWPVTRVGERHLFQFGAMGGLSPEEYHEGGPLVADLLARHGSHRRAWEPPEPTEEAAEAEWGFEPALGEDLASFARRRGFRVRRLAFREPEDLSPLVADLHREWYRERGLPANRIVIESFILQEPWWTLRTGSVPFWTKFPVEPDAAALQRYLAAAPPYTHAHAMLFTHGTRSAGLAYPDRWRELLGTPSNGATILGSAEERFPLEFSNYFRYQRDLRRHVPARYPIPRSLTLGAVEEYLAERAGAHGVRYEETARDGAAA